MRQTTLLKNEYENFKEKQIQNITYYLSFPSNSPSRGLVMTLTMPEAKHFMLLH